MKVNVVSPGDQIHNMRKTHHLLHVENSRNIQDNMETQGKWPLLTQGFSTKPILSVTPVLRRLRSEHLAWDRILTNNPQIRSLLLFYIVNLPETEQTAAETYPRVKSKKCYSIQKYKRKIPHPKTHTASQQELDYTEKIISISRDNAHRMGKLFQANAIVRSVFPTPLGEGKKKKRKER